jgi:hypothetical protein
MERFARAFQIGLGISALVALASAAGWAGGTPSEKCVFAKLAAAREFTACVLKAQEKNLRKPRSGNAAVCLEKLTQRFDALEARVGADACPRRQGLGFLPETLDYAEEVDLAIRPPEELIVFDAGPASGFELWMEGPAAQCGPGNREELTCRRMPALVSDSYQAPDFLLASTFSFPQGIPLRSAGGVQIASDWDAFLNGTWDACLQTSPGPECATAAGVLPDGARWWSGYDPLTGEQVNCKDWSNPARMLTSYVGSASTDGSFGHPSPWGPEELACDAFPESDAGAPHVLCLCF